MAKKQVSSRPFIQGGWTILSNGYFAGFLNGRIYNGPLKKLCLPGLNCYSCPGSLGSCPIGALQAVLGSANYHISFYITGFLILMGTLFARFICGFLCPFGWIQELLHNIPFAKKIETFRGDRLLRFAKYFILVVFVILLPMVVVDAIGTGSPWFCKWICPAGMLEGGIPLVSKNPMLQDAVGWLFAWKGIILLITVLLSIIIYRPFCKYICPLGAIYALFNRISLYRYRVDERKCINCKQCDRACPMNISPYRETNHGECVRCGKCREICPVGAISSGFSVSDNPCGKDKRACRGCK